MAQHPIKRYLPKSLLGRAILILLFPIIFIEIVVGIAFIQRHFEQVTNQMSEGIAFEIIYIQKETEKGFKEKLSDDLLLKNISNLGEEFGFEVRFLKEKNFTRQPQIDLIDLSGKTFVKNLEEKLDKPSSFDLSDPRNVFIQIQFDQGLLEFKISRKRISASNPHQLLVLMLFVTILLVLLSLIILKNQIRPIGKLAKAAEAFGKGQFVEFRPGGSDEVRRAGIAFMAMRARIERQIKQRTQMLSGVSHDLRTPLTRLKLQLAMLKQKEISEKMTKDIDEMEKMLNDYLQFAKTQTQEDTVLINLNTLLESIKNSFNNNNLIFNNSTELVELKGRPTALKRSFENIIQNGLSYGKIVYLNIKKGNKRVTVLIEDDGPGIPEDQYKNVFKPFFRLDKSRSLNQSGVGLGLAIVEDIINSHGGNIQLGKSKYSGLLVKISLPF